MTMTLYKTILGLFINFLFVTNTVLASPAYDDYKKGLMHHFKTIKEKARSIGNGKIHELNLDEKAHLLPANKALYDAGESLIIYLRNTDEVYRQLGLSEWEKATNDLLVVDTWLGKHIAWGNLVIKIAISNKVINKILEYLEANKNYDADDITRILRVMKKLKWHLPTASGMYSLGFSYHETDNPFKVDSLHFFGKKVNSLKRKKRNFELKKIENHFSGDSVNIGKLLGIWLDKEIQVARSIADYQQLYNNPTPILIAYYSYYRQVWWHLNLHLLLLERNKGIKYDWEEINAKDVMSILTKVYQGEDKFWVDDYYVKFYENYTDGTEINKKQEYFMKRFREDRRMSAIWGRYSRRSMRIKFARTFDPNNPKHVKSSRLIGLSALELP